MLVYEMHFAIEPSNFETDGSYGPNISNFFENWDHYFGSFINFADVLPVS